MQKENESQCTRSNDFPQTLQLCNLLLLAYLLNDYRDLLLIQ